jgi:uncharacterized protein YjbI with pentapeptide repeats
MDKKVVEEDIDALQDLVEEGVSLAGIDISNAILPKIDLRNADLIGANLDMAVLFESNFSGANLTGAYISGTYLSGSKLFLTNFSKAQLCNTNLTGANLSEAKLNGANLTGAILRMANLKYTKLDGIEGWDKIWSIKLANIYGVIASNEFVQWAKKKGAVEFENYDEWQDYIKNKQKKVR